MVKITDRNSQKWELGRNLISQSLRKRVDVDQLFAPGVEDMLIETSGGHPRQLMMLVRYAIDFIDEAPVTVDAIQKAKRKAINDYSRSIPEAHWDLLAVVGRDKIVKNDADHQLMLYNLSVLEYQNNDRWCDVNPIVRAVPQFADATQRLALAKKKQP
jgi:hypothetical protein